MRILNDPGIGWETGMADTAEADDSTEQLPLTLRKRGDSKFVENHAKMLIVGAGARFLFYPTLLYNVVRNKFQAEFRWWDEIDQFLLLGAVPFPRHIPSLKDAGVHAVVTLNESYETLVHTSLYKDQGINHLAIPTRDYLFAPSFADIQRAVDFIHEHARCGKRTYVHCKAGRGRSTTVVICYLVEHRGMTPLEALHYVRAKRPRVLLASSQWQAVQDYSKLCQSRCIVRRALTTPSGNSQFSVCEAPSNDVNESTLTEDSAVLVSMNDLVGYRGIEDAGLVGNELWKDIGVLCRLRLLASRNLAGMGKASTAWSKLSCLWIGPQSGSNLLTTASEVGEAVVTCKKMASSMFPGHGLEVPLCHSGMVN